MIRAARCANVIFTFVFQNLNLIINDCAEQRDDLNQIENNTAQAAVNIDNGTTEIKLVRSLCILHSIRQILMHPCSCVSRHQSISSPIERRFA